MKVRDYQMSARAASVEDTGERILDETLVAFAGKPYDRIRLDDIAERSGVTVQTVIRRFGGKAGVVATMVARELGRIVDSRAVLAPDDPAGTVRALVDHYEKYGELILKFYREAPVVPGLTELAVEGRAGHVAWCMSAFGEGIEPGIDRRTRARREAQIVTICDVSTWRLLRIDRRLPPSEVRSALEELLFPLLGRQIHAASEADSGVRS